MSVGQADHEAALRPHLAQATFVTSKTNVTMVDTTTGNGKQPDTEAFGNNMPSQAVFELAYAAVPWRGQVEQPPEVQDAAKDYIERAAIKATAQRLLDEISALPPQVKEDLKEEITALQDAAKSGKLKNLNMPAIERAINGAKGNASAKDAVESPQQKVDRLWKEMEEDKKIADKVLSKVPLTKEEQDKKAELDRKLREAEESKDPKVWEELALFYKQMGKKYDRKELIEAAERIEKNAKKSSDELQKSVQKEDAILSSPQALTDSRKDALAVEPARQQDPPATSKYPSAHVENTQSAQLDSPNVPGSASNKGRQATVADSF